MLNCRKRDRPGVRCFRLGRLGCRVILPGENNITAHVKTRGGSCAAHLLLKAEVRVAEHTFISTETASTLVFHHSYVWVVDERQTVESKADDADVDVIPSVLTVTH